MTKTKQLRLICELQQIEKLSFPGGSVIKSPPSMQEMWGQPLSQADPLEKEMATHCSILAWEIPWTEEPAELGVAKRVRDD